MRAAIFGGSFDPIHVGHLYIAEEVRENLGYDTVIFVPSNIPPHKLPSQKVDAQHRVKMVNLAVQGNTAFVVDDFEVTKGGVSYTIDTIKYVLANYPLDGKPGLIIGDDLAAGFEKWKSVREILDLAEVIVARRGRQAGDIEYSEADGGIADGSVGSTVVAGMKVRTVDNLTVPVSSSDIRDRIATGRPFRYLVPESVYAYIRELRLYTT